MRRFSWTAFGLIAAAISAGCTTVTTEEPDPPSLDPWAKAVPGNATPMALASGADGDLFLGGTFNGAIDFGDGQLTSEPHSSLFMAHLDAAGGHLFSASTGSQDDVRSVAIGAEGDLYIAGGYNGFINFGEGVMSGTYDGYFAAFAKDGASAYAKSLNGAINQIVVDRVQAAPSGNVIIAARADDTTDFGLGIGASPQNVTQDVIAAYDRAGKALWEARLSAYVNEITMAVDGAGNVLVAGVSYGEVDLGSFKVDGGVFLGKISADGKPLWLRSVVQDTGGNLPTIHDLAADDAGNVYFSGVYYNSFSFGDLQLPGAGNQNGYMIKAGPDGAGLFAKAFVPQNYIQNVELAVSGKGDILVAMSAYGGVDFGSGNTSTSDSYDALVARFSPGGDFVKSMTLDGTGSEYIFDMALGPNDKPVICGAFDSVLDFDKTRLVADTSLTMFLARLDF